jgi:hypothetical protein
VEKVGGHLLTCDFDCCTCRQWKERVYGSCSATESTCRNWIRKPRSAVVMDALDFDLRGDE